MLKNLQTYLRNEDFLAGNAYIKVEGYRYVNNVQLLYFPHSPILYPGSFNPVHDGHIETIAAMRAKGLDVSLEISPANVDKGSIDPLECLTRIYAIIDGWPDTSVCPNIYVGMAPTFLDKKKMYGAKTFAVGADTMLRILDPKYGNVFKTVEDTSFFISDRVMDGVQIDFSRIMSVIEESTMINNGVYHHLETSKESQLLSSRALRV